MHTHAAALAISAAVVVALQPGSVTTPRLRTMHGPEGTRLVQVAPTEAATPPPEGPRRFELVHDPLRGPTLVQRSGGRAEGFVVEVGTRQVVRCREVTQESWVLDEEGEWSVVAHAPRIEHRERVVYGCVSVECATAWHAEDVAWRAMNRPHGVGALHDLALPVASGDEGPVEPVSVVVRARELGGVSAEVARVALRGGAWTWEAGDAREAAMARARADFEAARALRDPAREARARAADRAAAARRLASWRRAAGLDAAEDPAAPSVKVPAPRRPRNRRAEPARDVAAKSVGADVHAAEQAPADAEQPQSAPLEASPPPSLPVPPAVQPPPVEAPSASAVPPSTFSERVAEVCAARRWTEAQWLRAARQPGNLFAAARFRVNRDPAFAPQPKVLQALSLAAGVEFEWLRAGSGRRDVGPAISARSLGSDAQLHLGGLTGTSNARPSRSPAAQARRPRRSTTTAASSPEEGAL